MKTCGECAEWTRGEGEIGTCANPPEEPSDSWPRAYNRDDDPACENFKPKESKSMIDTEIPTGYIAGLGRDHPAPPLSHLYRGDFKDPGLPMCACGWNRGEEYSIWRGNVGAKGVCKVCLRRARKGLAGVEPSPKLAAAYEARQR